MNCLSKESVGNTLRYITVYRQLIYNRLSFVFQIKHKMPSTRSQGRAQPTLSFPRRKSCRVSSRSKAPQLDKSPAPSPTKPEPKPLVQIGPLSPRRLADRPTPLSPRRPAAQPPSSPSLQPRLPLSPRKRTGERSLVFYSLQQPI